MKQAPRNVKRAFLISSFIGSVLKAHNTGRPILNAIHTRVNQGMKRYRIVAGMLSYHSLANDGQNMWVELSKRHSTHLTHEETEIFIEILGFVLSERDYKDFLGYEHFRTRVRTDDAKYARICVSVLQMNDMINELLGTKSSVCQIKQKKTEKIKTKRDGSRKLSKHEKEVLNAEAKKKRKVEFLANLKARANELRKEKQ
jgi:hypothetical protein